MEDNSYVNLSLEKYNELYDKAKKFDELSEKLTDEIRKNINKIFDGISETLTTDNEEETEDTEFKLGDRVRLVELGSYTKGFNKGDIYTIANPHYDDSEECIKITDYDGLDGFVSKKQIEKIKEEK